MGRRAHKPSLATRRQVEAMAAYGVPETNIARVLGVDPKTLRKHYREEFDTGHVKATARSPSSSSTRRPPRAPNASSPRSSG